MSRKARSFRPDFQSTSATLETRELLATLPQGLVIKNLSENLGGPTTFVSDHESKMFVGDLEGTIRSISLLDGKATVIGKVDTENVDARGLYGLAMDPGFATNRTLYAFYYALDGAGGREVRVSKLMVHESTDPSMATGFMETVLMRIKISNSPQMHHGGALEVDKSGYLYFAIGDIEEPKKISKIDMPNGKVFRIRTDGTIPTDNPFYKRSKGLGRAVWATGFREPMKSSYDSTTDTYLIHDVGWFQTEELNVIKKGANYGWPYFEGKNQGRLKGGNSSQVTFPFYSYQNMTSLTQKALPLRTTKKVKSMIALNTDVGCATMGGVYYRPTKLQDAVMSEYVGDYLFVDLCSGWVNALDYNTRQVKRFADQVEGQLMDVEYTNDGRIFLLCRGDASVDNQIKLIEVQQNDPPAFSNDGGSIIASAGESLDLNATASGPGPFNYQWYHNGQSIPDSVEASLKFTSLNQQTDSGQYYVTAKNSFGETASMPWDIQVADRARPTVNLTISKEGQTIKKGDQIAFSATATDEVDGDLGASQFSWNLELRHNTHGHPVFALANTKASEFTVGDYSYETGNLSLKLTLTVTNSIGLTRTVTKQWPVVI